MGESAAKKARIEAFEITTPVFCRFFQISFKLIWKKGEPIDGKPVRIGKGEDSPLFVGVQALVAHQRRFYLLRL